MTPLVSTTERVVDMVLSIDTHGENKNQLTNNNILNFSNPSHGDGMDIETPIIQANPDNIDQILEKNLFKNNSNLNLNNTSHLSDCIQEDINMSNNIEPEILSNSQNDLNSIISDKTSNTNIKHISKRILCELIKSDINENEKEIANEISKKLDYLLDVILNKSENKIHFIQLFMCFIVEINSELIRILPEYKNIDENLNMRFIIIAKNIYNFAIEVYFSLNDLYNIDINTFMEIFKKKFPLKFEENIGKCVLYFYKIITDEILKNNNKAGMSKVLENVYNETFGFWEIEIIEKGQELKRFCTV